LTDDIADRFLLLGDNGTGKTTVLQAGLTHHNKPSRLFGQG
jgi:ABC-type molybdenum transport system ATPase subunit/photorepair protein PhrA